MNGPQQDQDQIEQFNHFEQEFTRVMRPAEPPANFTNAVLERAMNDARPPARVLSMQSRWRATQTWAAGAVAAALLVGVGLQQFHHRQERAKATREFEVAAQIEQQALDKTRERLSRSGISLESQ